MSARVHENTRGSYSQSSTGRQVHRFRIPSLHNYGSIEVVQVEVDACARIGVVTQLRAQKYPEFTPT